MNILNFNDLKTLLNDLTELDDGIELDAWMGEDVSADAELSSLEVKEILQKIGSFEFTDHYGGEGSGDDYWTVVHFKDHDIYVQFDGWYASHCGAEFEDMFQVWPQEVMKIEWTRNDLQAIDSSN